MSLTTEQKTKLIAESMDFVKEPHTHYFDRIAFRKDGDVYSSRDLPEWFSDPSATLSLVDALKKYGTIEIEITEQRCRVTFRGRGGDVRQTKAFNFTEAIAECYGLAKNLLT